MNSDHIHPKYPGFPSYSQLISLPFSMCVCVLMLPTEFNKVTYMMAVCVGLYTGTWAPYQFWLPSNY